MQRSQSGGLECLWWYLRACNNYNMFAIVKLNCLLHGLEVKVTTVRDIVSGLDRWEWRRTVLFTKWRTWYPKPWDGWTAAAVLWITPPTKRVQNKKMVAFKKITLWFMLHLLVQFLYFWKFMVTIIKKKKNYILAILLGLRWSIEHDANYLVPFLLALFIIICLSR